MVRVRNIPTPATTRNSSVFLEHPNEDALLQALQDLLLGARGHRMAAHNHLPETDNVSAMLGSGKGREECLESRPWPRRILDTTKRMECESARATGALGGLQVQAESGQGSRRARALRARPALHQRRGIWRKSRSTSSPSESRGTRCKGSADGGINVAACKIIGADAEADLEDAFLPETSMGKRLWTSSHRPHRTLRD